MGRSPQGEALGMLHHNSHQTSCGIEKGSKRTVPVQPQLFQDGVLCISHKSLCASNRSKFVSPDCNFILEDKSFSFS